jgi:methylmalonyl-CoA mutase
MSKNINLFKEFPIVSAKEWKQQIQMELKGADYTDTLVWESLEGIHVKPFYHGDTHEFLTIPIPKQDFIICQEVFIDDPAIANKIALDTLKKGANAIQFIANQSFDLDVLLQGFNELKTNPTIYFKNHFFSPKFIENLLDFFNNNSIIIQQDIIGNFAQSGNWFNDENTDFNYLKKLIKKYPNRIILGVDVSIYQNAGANIIQQVVYALSHANEYLTAFGEEVSNSIIFEFSTGGNYFFEIAKLRAFRYLWQQITKEYNIKNLAHIVAKPSSRNKTLYDYNVNTLRTTTEYMSAILGSADTVITRTYDSIFKKSNAFSERIARNQLLLLKEENGFKNAQIFAKGSYYIEAITLEIAKKALHLFKEIEKSGGFLKQLKEDIIQTKIKEAALKEQQLFDGGKITLLGTNKYPNPNDVMRDELNLYPFVKNNKKQTTIQPIIAKRLAEKFEQERLKKEN